MLAQEVGSYHESGVSQQLNEHFACVWIHRLPVPPGDPIVVVPDGAIDLQWIGGRWRIAGPDSSPQSESLPTGTVVVGFRFQPGSAAAWLRIALSELRNQRVWLDEVWGVAGRKADAAAEAACGHNLDSLGALQSVLAGWATAMPLADPLMQKAHRMLSRGGPSDTHVNPWLMKELGLSERTLRRRFETVFGYGPKVLDRILRFQRYLELARKHSRVPMTYLAADAGYADQSHLIRECRRLAMCTPGKFS